MQLNTNIAFLMVLVLIDVCAEEKINNSPQLYKWMKGAISSGVPDIHIGSYNFVEAEAYCTSQSMCVGFTFQSPDKTPVNPVKVYFKSGSGANGDSKWNTYLKIYPPDYPDKNFTVGGLKVGLRPKHHTVQILGLVNDMMPPFNFSFVPPLTNGNRKINRAGPRCHALGDITLRIQPASETNVSSWATYSTAWASPDIQVVPLKVDGKKVLVADDITHALKATPKQQYSLMGLNITRSYEKNQLNRDAQTIAESILVIRFNITNNGTKAVRIGGFGMSLVADDWTDQKLDKIAYTNSFVDPHIGQDRGFAEWIRVVGNRSLLVLPANPSTRMEAWRPILEDCDGVPMEWTVITGAWANEWHQNKQAPFLNMDSNLNSTGVWPNPKSPWPEWHSNETLNTSVKLWNPPTTMELKSGETINFAWKFQLSPKGPRTRDQAMEIADASVIHAVPGYTISTTMTTAKLLILPPKGTTVSKVIAMPSNILTIGASGKQGKYTSVDVRGKERGRCRVAIIFSDNTTEAVHYYVLPSFKQQITAFGHHLAHVAWLPRDFPDPFGRSASVMPWDREDKRHVLQDSRAYIVGLSDDAGAANNLAHAMKISYMPEQSEVTHKDDYIKWTLYGVKPDIAKPPLRSLQGRPEDGPKFEDHIRMTMFYYCATPGNCTHAGDPPKFKYDYTEQNKCHMPVGGPIWCMTENMANATYRGFNVPHQTASYYAMYRVARHYNGIKTYQTWQWYLERAYKTISAVGSPGVGFMDGTVFREVLLALKEEGLENRTFEKYATLIEQQMKKRADGWSTQTFPFGSEFNFDTTGQEEVYIWLSYFSYRSSAVRTLNAILGYMRSLPSWAYNGGATSQGDLGNNGKWFINKGHERGLMHYRSGLNMIPLIEEYRRNPDDFILLEIAMGAIAGQLTNIDQDGATSMMFHSYPFVLQHDPYSGDYGCGFFGHALEAGAYFVNHTDLGFLCFLCDFDSTDASSVTIEPRDSFHIRIYLEPIGIYLVLQVGEFKSLSFNLMSSTISMVISPSAGLFSNTRLQILKPGTSRPGSNFKVTNPSDAKIIRDVWEFSASKDAPTSVVITFDQ